MSGLITEASEGWSIDDIRPFAQHVIAAFGPDRVMWGSDWPVCRLQAEYDDWLDLAQVVTSGLSEGARHQVFGASAARFYGLA